MPPATPHAHLRPDDVARILGAKACHRRGWTGKGVRLAMIDTGFAPHPYLESCGFRVDTVARPDAKDAPTDPSGHGTASAALTFTVAPDSEIIGFELPAKNVAKTLELALERSPQLVVGCWGWSYDARTLDHLRVRDPALYLEFLEVERLVARGTAAGTCFVFAGGNGGQTFPATLPDVIAVGGASIAPGGAFVPSGATSRFESTLYDGRRVPDVCGLVGPSRTDLTGQLLLPVPRSSSLEGKNLPFDGAYSGWGLFSGSSAAAAQVAGVIALLLQAAPSITPREIRRTLVATGTMLDGDEHAPLANALAACVRASDEAGDRDHR